MRLSKQTCMGNRLRAWSARLCLRETVCTGGGCFWGIVADKNVRCCAPPHRSYCATKKLLDLREICGEVCWKMRPFSRARESKRALAEWRHVTSLTCGKFRGGGCSAFTFVPAADFTDARPMLPRFASILLACAWADNNK